MATASGKLSDNLVSCRFCDRKFNSDRIQTHEQICQKTSNKKRKVFDIAKHRVLGTDFEKYARKATKVSNKAASGKGPALGTGRSELKCDWRRKHEDFINAIQAAKKVQIHLARGGKLSDLPPPPPSENPDYIQCPHCLRRFNEAAAARHIPKCATYEHNKPKPLNRTTGKGQK